MASLAVLVTVAGVAVWSLRDARVEESVGLLVWGVVCAIWAMFIALAQIRRSPLGEIDEQGITLNYIFSRMRIGWNDITWFSAPPEKRAAIIAVRKPGDAKEHYAVVSRSVFGDAQVAAIRDAIAAKRPGLPDQPNDAQVFS
ncbi:hypothetical protein K1T73_06040 [Roseovarius sp. SCSIO 43702]|uniref:PH domain-containing protein n=1 Tax=Roseovarius sp. SCSIO 43702 TaxID=2823043 RepID=UPI001C73A750|nr:PH domain-containing protein [Roseovarius sp. SCSIO 43702]QYX57944.1 hypothetical protein K1T73_06040 [Roseovarius sp. SCSIO 43702]